MNNLMDLSDPEKILLLNENYFNDLIFHIYWKDKKGKYLGCNQSTAQSAGLNSMDQLIGNTDFDLCWANYAAEYRLNDKKTVTLVKPWAAIESIVKIDGSIHKVFSYKNPILTRSKKVIGSMGISLKLENDLASSQLLNYNHEGLESGYIVSNFLTPRQKQCLNLLIKGKTIKAIAYELNLSARTVEHYIEAVKIKFNCNTRTELIVKAIKLGYIAGIV